MARALKKITPKATDKKLKEMLATSQEGIAAHAELLKSLIEGQGEKVSKEHCKGMEGLAAEAIKHTIGRAASEGPDARRRHYHAVPTHDALWHRGLWDCCGVRQSDEPSHDTKKLKAATKDIYDSDEFAIQMAETAVNRGAKPPEE